jgi:hypothetical protein
MRWGGSVVVLIAAAFALAGFGGLGPAYIEGEPPFDAEITFQASP